MFNNRLAVFPICREFIPLLRIENDITKNYFIIDAYAEKSQGIIGRDVNFLDAGDVTGVIIKDIKDIGDYDSILITKHPQILEFKDIVFKLIEKSLTSNKTVYDFSGLFNEYFESIHKYISAEKIRKQNSIQLYENKEKTIHTHVPIVLICGLTADPNLLTFQLELRKELYKDNIKVSQIGSNDFCELLGFHSFPNEIQENKYGYAQTIDFFKTYINSIIYNESPDVMVIGVPGGIMPYNHYINNEYGYLAYIVSSAISISHAFVCIPFMERQFYSKEYFNLLDNILYYKFAIRNKTYCVSNVAKQNNPSQKERFYDVPIDKKTFWAQGDYKSLELLNKYSIISLFDGIDNMSSELKIF